MRRSGLGLLLGFTVCVAGAPVLALPSINGSIDSGEGWLLLTERGYARPVLGGSPTGSDDTGESSQFHWWDGSDHSFVTGPRGGVNNLYYASDASHLFLGVVAGTAPFNAWGDSGGNNDQGNLYIAIDLNGGTQLNANSGHSSYGGIKAVDFNGWQPDYVVGTLFVDNGGGGGGAANIEQAITHLVTGGNPQGTPGAFEWNALSIGGGLAHYEYKIAWSLLGLGAQPVGSTLRMAMYMTQNGEHWDAYDSGPGLGNGTAHEQIGDSPNDYDTAGRLGATDVLGANVPFGSFPGSNFVPPGFQNADMNNDYNLVGYADDIDTIEEYLEIMVVPEPSAAALVLLGLAAMSRMRRRR